MALAVEYYRWCGKVQFILICCNVLPFQSSVNKSRISFIKLDLSQMGQLGRNHRLVLLCLLYEPFICFIPVGLKSGILALTSKQAITHFKHKLGKESVPLIKNVIKIARAKYGIVLSHLTQHWFCNALVCVRN